MSVSVENIAALLQHADPTAVAALLQMASSGNAAAVQQPKAAEKYDWQPIPRDWQTGYDIIRELRSRQFDSEAVVTSAAVEAKGKRPAYPEGVAATWDDGDQITFGDLLFVEEGGATNANGEAVNNYPVVWSLTWPEAKGALQFLRNCPRKEQQPKAAGGRGKNGGKAASQPKAADAEGIEVMVQRAIATAMAQMFGGEAAAAPAKPEPAKPEPAIGHRKAAKPLSLVPDAQPASPVELTPGQTVVWQGQHFVLTLQANGRIGQQRVVG